MNKNSPEPEVINPYFESIGSASVEQKMRYSSLILRPHVSLNGIRIFDSLLDALLNNFKQEAIQDAEIEIKYEGYLKKEQEIAQKMNSLENFKIHLPFDYNKVSRVGKKETKEVLITNF